VSKVRSFLPGAVSPGGILLYEGGLDSSRMIMLKTTAPVEISTPRKLQNPDHATAT
jgi:hypothetical protein